MTSSVNLRIGCKEWLDLSSVKSERLTDNRLSEAYFRNGYMDFDLAYI